MKFSFLAFTLMLTFTHSALAKNESFEHPHCKVNYLILSNASQFGKYGYLDMNDEDTQRAVKLLEEKGYIFDQEFIEADLALKAEDRTGLFVAVRAIYTRVPQLNYFVGSNGAKVTIVRNRVFSESVVTISMRTMAEDTSRFLRSIQGRNKNFFFDYMKSIPECRINPDVKLDTTIYR